MGNINSTIYKSEHKINPN